MSYRSIFIKRLPGIFRTYCRSYDAGMLGGGIGKGGGGGGPTREVGGPFGKLGAVRENGYFYNLQRRLLLELIDKLNEENQLRIKEIERHQWAINENVDLSQEIEEKLKDFETYDK